MKIEKKIVRNSATLSLAAKSAIAASLGIAAVTLTACEESGTAAAPNQTDIENPETGAPENEAPSSSSVVDIPLSHEALSSSAVEALSSAAEPLSSSSFEEPYPPPEAGTIAAPTDEDIYGPNSSSSSEEEAQNSSAEEPVPLAGDPIIVEEESSSSEAEQPSSSSVNTLQACSENDPWCIQVHMCNNEDGCMAASMVSTYERSDIAG
jgi:hypothetical protein